MSEKTGDKYEMEVYEAYRDDKTFGKLCKIKNSEKWPDELLPAFEESAHSRGGAAFDFSIKKNGELLDYGVQYNDNSSKFLFRNYDDHPGKISTGAQVNREFHDLIVDMAVLKLEVKGKNISVQKHPFEFHQINLEPEEYMKLPLMEHEFMPKKVQLTSPETKQAITF